VTDESAGEKEKSRAKKTLTADFRIRRVRRVSKTLFNAGVNIGGFGSSICPKINGNADKTNDRPKVTVLFFFAKKKTFAGKKRQCGRNRGFFAAERSAAVFRGADVMPSPDAGWEKPLAFCSPAPMIDRSPALPRVPPRGFKARGRTPSRGSGARARLRFGMRRFVAIRH
jgi:hypothetical protein